LSVCLLVCLFIWLFVCLLSVVCLFLVESNFACRCGACTFDWPLDMACKARFVRLICACVNYFFLQRPKITLCVCNGWCNRPLTNHLLTDKQLPCRVKTAWNFFCLPKHQANTNASRCFSLPGMDGCAATIGAYLIILCLHVVIHVKVISVGDAHEHGEDNWVMTM